MALLKPHACQLRALQRDQESPDDLQLREQRRCHADGNEQRGERTKAKMAKLRKAVLNAKLWKAVVTAKLRKAVVTATIRVALTG